MSIIKKPITIRTPFILSLVFLVSLIAFTTLAVFVASGITLPFDREALLWINAHASPVFDTFFKIFTELGGIIVVTLTVLSLFVYFLYKKAYPKAVLISVGVGGVAAVGFILKAIFERPRPDLWEWLIVETNFSFPSGHAVASSALALCCIALLWRTKWRAWSIIVGVMYILLIGASRLYLGVHYPTDILGGWLLSMAWIAGVTAIIYLFVFDNPKKKDSIL